MRSTLSDCILMFLLCVLLPGCGRGTSASGGPDSPVDLSFGTDIIEAEADVTSDAKAWADSLMADMSLEELAGQLIMPAVFSDAGEPALRSVAAYAADLHVGGVVLLKGSVEAARTIADTLRALSAAPPFIAIDAEWGLAMRLKNTPKFPKNGAISASAEESLLFDYGCEVARECRLAGVNMVLGPVLDVLPESDSIADRLPASSIGNRSFGSDPQRVSLLGVAYARGVESGGVMSVAKHFPGHGAADADSHQALPVVSKSFEQLQASDLLPFRNYVRSGLSGIMVGHLRIPALCDGPLPASVSPDVLRGLLREDMGFKGLVLTDAMNMAGADGQTGADAIMAGADMVIAPGTSRREVEALVGAVRNGSFPLSELRDRVARVLFYKYLMAKDITQTSRLDSEEAKRLQRELAKKHF